MTGNKVKPGYFARVVSALLGKSTAPGTIENTEGSAELRSRIASLEMDLHDRDKRIEQMQKEYASLSGEKDRAGSDAGKEQMEKLWKSLSGSLSNIATISDMIKAGKEVESSEFVTLFDNLEKTLQRNGLQRIGKVGEKCEFNSSLHQRMSGGTVHQGREVAIRIPGYRTEQSIITKAMVTARED